MSNAGLSTPPLAGSGSTGAPADRQHAGALRRSPLHEEHVAAGAKLIEFAGFEMPAHYAGSSKPVNDEHMAVRSSCGVFDVSHMGEIEVLGAGAEQLLQRVLSNDLTRLSSQAAGADASQEEGGAQYSLVCAPDGGVLEDLIAYRLGPERYLLVTNAANHPRDFAWIREQAGGFEVEVKDRAEDYGMLAVQGPAARSLLGELAESALPARMRMRPARVAGVEVIACGTGYTGEDGLELLCDPDQAAELWRALLAHGARPAGLAARDTLRIEACLPLYGNELTPARSPIAAGLGWCCREQTGFVGAEAVAAARAEGPAERLVAFRMDSPGIARQGNTVGGGGEVTSGTHSPCLGVGVGLAYVPGASATPGTALEIDVRGRTRVATVVQMPLVAKRA